MHINAPRKAGMNFTDPTVEGFAKASFRARARAYIAIRVCARMNRELIQLDDVRARLRLFLLY